MHQLYYLETHINIKLLSLPKCLLLSGLLPILCRNTHFSRTPFLDYSNRFYFMIILLFGGDYWLWSTLLCIFRYHSVTSALLGSNFLLRPSKIPWILFHSWEMGATFTSVCQLNNTKYQRNYLYNCQTFNIFVARKQSVSQFAHVENINAKGKNLHVGF
jgi:hypothetical protein